jgi:hypothetical protein
MWGFGFYGINVELNFLNQKLMLNKFIKLFKSEKKETDDFIKRLRSLVIGEGMLKEGNIALMDLAIKEMPKEGHVLEIGSYGGLSANLIIYLLQKHQRQNIFFTCDAWIYEGFKDHLPGEKETHIDGRKDISRESYSNYLKLAFINATKFLSHERLPYAFHKSSDTFFEAWKNQTQEKDVFDRTINLGGQISFAYIDGGHSYETAWNDFNNVTLHLAKNGFILLDDSGDNNHFGSARMMRKIKKDKRFKIVEKYPNYLLQKIK